MRGMPRRHGRLRIIAVARVWAGRRLQRRLGANHCLIGNFRAPALYVVWPPSSEAPEKENHKLCVRVSRAAGTIILEADYRPGAVCQISL